MPHALNAQTFGSIMVIIAFAAGEGAADYLAAHPASPLAWYLNIEVFRPFELARIDASPLQALFRPAALPIAACFAILALAARMMSFRLGVAVIANICFACTAALVYFGLGHGGTLRSASLSPSAVFMRPDLAVVAVMAASSFLAFAASHVSFVLDIRADRDRPNINCLDHDLPKRHGVGGS